MKRKSKKVHETPTLTGEILFYQSQLVKITYKFKMRAVDTIIILIDHFVSVNKMVLNGGEYELGRKLKRKRQKTIFPGR